VITAKMKDVAVYLRRNIKELAKQTDKEVIRIMEVCGTHTMAIHQFGIDTVMPANLRLLSGPGCPVCVTGSEYLNAAMNLAVKKHVIVTFGDMMKVPAQEGRTLASLRAEGYDIRTCYSPIDALRYAETEKEKSFIFLAVGFETTIPTILTMLELAQQKQLDNLKVLLDFKRVPPALELLVSDPELKIDGFLLPGHASIILGEDGYADFFSSHPTPCAITGFEALDILSGIESVLKQIVTKDPKLDNQYKRVVSKTGNVKAKILIEQYLEVSDAHWRGIGIIPDSGYRLKNQYQRFDAQTAFGISITHAKDEESCPTCSSTGCNEGHFCANILKGLNTPPECPDFGKYCNPMNPKGPMMVSSEGSCAAWFKYNRRGGNDR
jgi:hydrogenase expression/formation protein HypD